MQASGSSCTIATSRSSEQEDSVSLKHVPKPGDQDRMRFGFKPRRATQPAERCGLDTAAIPSPARSRCGAPSSSPSRAAPDAGSCSASFAPLVNLVDIVDEKLGDPREGRELVNAKLVSDPRVFKERIAEVTDLNTKLKDAIKKAVERRKDVREAIAKAQADLEGQLDARAQEVRRQRQLADDLRQKLDETTSEAERKSRLSESLQKTLKESDGKNSDLREEVKQHQKRLDTASSRATEVEKKAADLSSALEKSRKETKAAEAAAEHERQSALEAARELQAAQSQFKEALEEQRAHATVALNEAKAEASTQLSDVACQWTRKGEEIERQQRELREELQAKCDARVEELETAMKKAREDREAEARGERERFEKERAEAHEELAQARAAAQAAAAEQEKAAAEERRAMEDKLREKARELAEQEEQLKAAAKAEAEESRRLLEEERAALRERLREKDRAAEEQLAKLRAAADAEGQERQRVADEERAALQAQLRERDKAAADQRADFQNQLRAQDAAAAEEREAMQSNMMEGQKAASEMRANFQDQLHEKEEAAKRERDSLQARMQAQLQDKDTALERATAAFNLEREQLKTTAATGQAALQASKEHATDLQSRLISEQESAARLSAESSERQSQLDAARAQLEVLRKTSTELASERERSAALASESTLLQSQLEVTRSKLEELQGVRGALATEQEARAKLQSDLTIERSHLEAARAQLEEMQAIRANLAAEQEARGTLMADSQVQQSQLQTARAQLEEAQRAKAALATTSETLQSQLGQARAELEESRRSNAVLSTGETSLRSQLAALRAEMTEEKSKSASLQEDLKCQAAELEEAKRAGVSMASSEAALKAQLAATRAEVEEESNQCVGLTNSIQDLMARLEAARKATEASKAELAQERSDRRKAEEELRSQAEVSAEQARSAEQERRLLEVEFRSYKDHHGTSNAQQLEAISDLKMTVEKLSVQYDQTKSDLVEQHSNMALKQSKIMDLERQVAEAEASRRQLHNAMQELKGNIRVMCRVRPDTTGGEQALQLQDSGKLSLCHGQEPYSFSFDKVFGTGCPQEDVFEEVSGLVQSALDGYKVCLFAYGQTGSGKTFTMQGMPEPRLWGIIPRSLSKVFESSRRMASQGWSWSLEASFLEVYNESLRDLLRDGSDSQASSLAIQHCDLWGTVVANASRVAVDSMDQITRLMAKAAKQRAVGSTDMNAQSSRSHSIFALYLRGTNEQLGTQLHGALHLVDLAGSERLDRSGAEGDRLRETKNINRSLSCLADVFAAKAEGRGHVPFRNSKLTYLMEPCLSGQGKTLMMVNVGPEAGNSHETLCSLRFAQRVSQCTTGGKPKRNVGALPGAGPESSPTKGSQRAPMSARTQSAATLSHRGSQRSLFSAR